MNPVGSVRAAASHDAAPPFMSQGPGRAPLPSPGLAGPADYQDALLLLMRADVQQSATNRLVGQGQIETNRREVATERKKEAEAVAAQEKAEKESHGFWAKLKKFAGTVAKVAAIVAAVAGSVFTGGASLIAVAGIVAVGLSSGAMIVRETHMFGKDSDKIGLGLDIASAVVGIAACGAGALQASQAATEVSTVSKAIVSGAEITGATATGTGAVAGGVVTGFQHDADLSAADAEQARGKMELEDRERKSVVEWLARVSEVEADSMATTTKTIEACNQAMDIAIAGVKG